MTIADRALLILNLTKCLRGELLIALPEDRRFMQQQIGLIALGDA